MSHQVGFSTILTADSSVLEVASIVIFKNIYVLARYHKYSILFSKNNSFSISKASPYLAEINIFNNKIFTLVGGKIGYPVENSC